MPPAADSMCPLRCVCAPVKEPFSWPNSSLSSRFSGMALQLMAMNGPFLLRAPAVERLRHHLLAGAAFAENQDRRAGRRHLADEREDGLHRRAGAQHVLEDLGPLALLQRAVFLLELGDVDAPLQHEPELVHVHRLAQEVVGAGPDGAKRVLLVALAGDDDHLGQRIQREERRERRQAFVGIVGTGRKPQIEQRHRGTVGRERRHGAGSVLGHAPPRSPTRAPTSSACGCPRRPPR